MPDSSLEDQEPRQPVAVIGGGLMGAGIAQIFAAAGHHVTVFEPNAEVRAGVLGRVGDVLKLVSGDPATLDSITVVDNMAEAVADAFYVTEAAPERLELKRAIFAQLEKLAPRTAILASNTSVIPITRIAEGLATPDRVVGTHWWNPPYLVPLVEVVQAANTSAGTIDTTMALLRSIGKKPAHVKKDLPGFVANRLQHALWREAIAMVAEGICDAATLDDCVKSSFGLRLPVLGPLENADLVGLDLTLDIHKTIIPELDRHAGPHEFLEQLVAEGKLGFKSGEGFKSWTKPEMEAVRVRLINHLVTAGKKKP
jgi:3-hydroxybutyryl-CoA dehydrogenase